MTKCYECSGLACMGIISNHGNYNVIRYYCKQDDPTRKIIRDLTPGTENYMGNNIEVNNNSDEFTESKRKEVEERQD